MVSRGDVVRIDGKEYYVTAVENYGFFVRGMKYIVLHTDAYEVITKVRKGEKS